MNMFEKKIFNIFALLVEGVNSVFDQKVLPRKKELSEHRSLTKNDLFCCFCFALCYSNS